MSTSKKKPQASNQVGSKNRSGIRTAKTNLDSTAEIVTSLVENLPLYQDTLQPVAKQIGRTLDTVWGGINALLAPVARWTYKSEQALEQYKETLVHELRDVPAEKLITPSKVVAGPILESLKYAVDEPHLRDMYAKLLATSMDAKVAHEAHPSFVEIIRQLTPDEA